MPITYHRLQSGSWGVRSTEPLLEGETVLVKKRNGSVKQETVERIVYTRNGVHIAAVTRPHLSGQRGGEYRSHGRS